VGHIGPDLRDVGIVGYLVVKISAAGNVVVDRDNGTGRVQYGFVQFLENAKEVLPEKSSATGQKHCFA
jgi:hypothetical protein